MNSTGSLLKVVTSLSVTKRMGIIVSNKIFSTNGFSFSIVPCCLVELLINLIAKLRAFDPTCPVFFESKV
jgi:hypothetical protein